MQADKHDDNMTKKLQWWQLSLLGVACTIGTGYFLGASIAITIAGPAVLISFVLAALGTYIVYDMLATMTAEDPLKGSFRSYEKKAYGRWAGFSSGWGYWSSELLIMGSQMAALSLFTRLWFPNVPMWIFASCYAVLALIIVMVGTKGFERMENLFAVVKIAAIIMFLVIASAALMGWIGEGTQPARFPVDEFFTAGVLGLWSSLIFAFYAFGGIEIMGLMAMRLRDPKQAPKAGKIMLITLGVIYVISLTLALMLIPWTLIHSKESPFVLALNGYDVAFVPHLFNAVFIIAGFSTLVASLFAVTTILVTLADDGDAPAYFAHRGEKKLPLRAVGLTTAGLLVSILMALLLPERLYEYVTTAAGLMLLYNWFFILVTSGRILRLSAWGKTKRFTGMTLIVLAVSGAVLHATSRPGFFISLAFVLIIGVVTIIMHRRWEREASESRASENQLISLQSEIAAKSDQRHPGDRRDGNKHPAR
ncbi:amino acid permease [Paenibacillus xerothermodurans]|uniref:Amino acid permease n=1 Tax=Paenibacillus xerothermodurans TaxID=1977292 RepID=A0A2W1P1N5_PAEXE|nr:amino acid permease [Paenibacillus xerothermodurans]PZE21028.1 amino acid permease [Paenibacillus xerothermodurans]